MTKAKFTRPDILTHPPIPAPLHGVNPRTVLGQKWWDETRYIAYEGNNRHCWACGRRTKKLDAHECYDIEFDKGVASFREVVALCQICHAFIHSNRLTTLADKGIYSWEYWNSVREHGYAVLTDAGLTPSPWARLNFEYGFEIPDELRYGGSAQWGDWRMIIFGKSVGSGFADREAHDKFYNDKNAEALRRIKDAK